MLATGPRVLRGTAQEGITVRTHKGDQECLLADICIQGTEHKLVLVTHIKGPGKDISSAKLCEQFVINLKEKN